MSATEIPTPSLGDKPSAAGLIQYLRDVRAELKPPKTEWPSRAELIRLTQVVLILIILVSICCGALDALLSMFVNRFHIFGN